MITICSTPTCGSRYDGSAAEAESKGSWRIQQCGPVCPSCVAGVKSLTPGVSASVGGTNIVIDHLPTSEDMTLRVAKFGRLQKMFNDAADEYADTHQTTLKRLNAIARIFGWMEQTDDPTTSRLQKRNDQLERQLADKDRIQFATIERLVNESKQEITRLTMELNDSRRDNVHLNTIIDNYQRHDLEQFTELEGRDK